jgi:hypothetical protein
MVKLGFIGEGAVEKRILESPPLREYLRSLKIDFIEEVIDANGNGNLLPHNIEAFTKILEDKGATAIIILTDLDEDTCITKTKERIAPAQNHFVIVSVKEIEAWFLADGQAMNGLLKINDFSIDHPEQTENPFEKIRELRIANAGIGFTTKVRLANLMVYKNNFSILRAANHLNCPSAKYFIEKINGFSFKLPST